MADFKLIENKWQKYWDQHPEISRAEDLFDNDPAVAGLLRKKYVLVEFPYPSGSGLHIGHAFSFTGADVYARFNRMMGYNVLFPLGWDAFGLPTENYAIKMKRKPQEITKEKYGDRYDVEQKDYAEKRLFGIDFDPRSVKIGKAMMLIAGDGKTNITFANSLERV